MSRAALLGPLTSHDSAFLAQHLEELTGNIVLECEHLDDLDTSIAAILLDFRDERSAQGYWVFYRGIPPRCSAQLLEHARCRAPDPEPANDLKEAVGVPYADLDERAIR
jgi:ABC-type transporter Mla MlaB component